MLQSEAVYNTLRYITVVQCSVKYSFMLRTYNSTVQSKVVSMEIINLDWSFHCIVGSLIMWNTVYLITYAPYHKLDQHNYPQSTPRKCDIIIPTKGQEGCNSPVTDFWKGDSSTIYDWFWTDTKLPRGREVARFSFSWHVLKVAWIFGELFNDTCGFSCWYIFNRTGVAGAVLQTVFWLIDSFIH